MARGAAVSDRPVAPEARAAAEVGAVPVASAPRPVLAAAASAPRRGVAELVAGRPLVIVAPHPDDETLGCGALLFDAARLGIDCGVICLTDGSASHRKSPSWPPGRLAAARRSELSAALHILAPDARLHWLGYPDCGLPCEGPEAQAAALAISHALPQGALVLTAWGGDPHIDHQRGAGLVRMAWADRPDLTVCAYPIWGRFRADAAPRGVVTVHASAEALAAKRRALACHATQMTRLIDDDPEGFVMTPADQAHFMTHPEILIAE